MHRRLLAALLLCATAWFPAAVGAWGDEGHQITARIAARRLAGHPNTVKKIAALLRNAGGDDLHLKSLLGSQPTPPLSAIEQAMSRMATWPDHIPGTIKKGKTGPWHFVDIGLFEGPSHIQQRCPGGNCVTGKIPVLIANITSGTNITTQETGGVTRTLHPDQQLRFLIHFLGDIHQPLHAATDADAGGNCIEAIGFGDSDELHAVWDTSLVREATKGMADPAGSIMTEFQTQAVTAASVTDPIAIATESFALARDSVYKKTKPAPAPVINQFVDVRPDECDTKAPQPIRSLSVDADASFDNPQTLKLVRERLFRGGVRLAAILVTLFP
jgi:hypothetical protein